MESIPGSIINGVKTYPITVILIVIWIAFDFFRRWKNRPRVLQRKRMLVKMEEDKPHPQWAVICSDHPDLIENYLAALAEGRLRTLLIYPGTTAPPSAQKCDKAISLEDTKEISNFFSYRHIKLLINAMAMSSDIDPRHKSNMRKLIDLSYTNMMQHSAGCLVTVHPEGAKRGSLGEDYSQYCKELVGMIKDKTDVYCQDMTLGGMEKGRIETAVKSSVREIADLTED